MSKEKKNMEIIEVPLRYTCRLRENPEKSFEVFIKIDYYLDDIDRVVEFHTSYIGISQETLSETERKRIALELISYYDSSNPDLWAEMGYKTFEEIRALRSATATESSDS